MFTRLTPQLGGWPITGPGRSAPLAHDFIRWTTTPEIQRTGVMPHRWRELWGLGWTGGPQYGARPELDNQARAHQYQFPTTHPEAIGTYDVQRCISTTLLAAPVTAWELGRHSFPSRGTGIIERVITSIAEAIATDADGVPLVTFTLLDAQGCREELIHPVPGAAALRWRWRLLARGANAGGPPVLALAGPLLARSPGVDLVPPWRDLRYGEALTWGDHQQIVVTGPALVSLWLELELAPAPTPDLGGWIVRAGGRHAGFSNSPGVLGVALAHATRRLH